MLQVSIVGIFISLASTSGVSLLNYSTILCLQFNFSYYSFFDFHLRQQQTMTTTRIIPPDALNIPIASLMSISALTIYLTVTFISIETVASGIELLGLFGRIDIPIIKFQGSPLCKEIILVWYCTKLMHQDQARRLNQLKFVERFPYFLSSENRVWPLFNQRVKLRLQLIKGLGSGHIQNKKEQYIYGFWIGVWQQLVDSVTLIV